VSIEKRAFSMRYWKKVKNLKSDLFKNKSDLLFTEKFLLGGKI
jgi:hypothetical protein